MNNVNFHAAGMAQNGGGLPWDDSDSLVILAIFSVVIIAMIFILRRMYRKGRAPWERWF